MKKKLLFSLLLGSAFSWMNGMYAADAVKAADVKVDAAGAKEKPAEAGKEAVAAPVEYTVKTTDGKDLKIKVHKKRDDIVYKNVIILDGAYANADTAAVRKVTGLDIPFVPGQKMPEGYIVVNIFFPLSDDGDLVDLYGGSGKKCKADFSKAIIQTVDTNNPNVPAGHGSPDEYTWMLMNEKTGEIFIAEMYPEPNNAKIYGDQMVGKVKKAEANKARSFYIPDPQELESAKISKKELEALKAGSGGASSEAVKKLEDELAASKAKEGTGVGGNAEAAKLLEVIKTSEASMAKATAELKQLSLSLGAQTNNGSALSQVFTIKEIPLTIVSTDPEALKNPSLFAQYVDAVIEMLRTRPQVAAALIAQMASDPVPGKVDSLSESRLADTLKENGKDITISGSLSFASSVAPAAARELRNELIKEYGSDKQAAQAALPAPVTPTLNATVASSIVPDVIPDGLSPMAKALLERKSKLKKVVVGTAATEIDAEKAKLALKDAELAAAEAEKKKLEAKLKATEEVAASAVEAAKKNQAEENANAAKLKETIAQANAIISAKDAEKAQFVAIIQQKDAQAAQVVANANAIIQQTEAEKNKTEEEKKALAAQHENVSEQLAKKEAELSSAHGAIIDIAKANANPAPTTPLDVQEQVHAPAKDVVANPTPAPVAVQEQVHAPAKDVVANPTPAPVAAHEQVHAPAKDVVKTPTPDAAKKVEVAKVASAPVKTK